MATLEARGIDAHVALGREGKTLVAVDPDTLPACPRVACVCGARRRARRRATHRMAKKLKSPQGRDTYAKCRRLSEGPNGWIKEVLGLRRFSFLGLEKAKGKWDLVCLALNVKRTAWVAPR